MNQAERERRLKEIKNYVKDGCDSVKGQLLSGQDEKEVTT